MGRAGQLLTKIIEACGWQRSDVYIMNVLKCRPPDNRNPLPNETDNCRPFFERQFEILRPEYIVCVGTVPAQALLETADPSASSAAGFTAIATSKSSSRITRRTCCAIRARRNTSGTICRCC